MMIYWIINLLISSSITHFHLLLFCLNMWCNKLHNDDIESSIFLILSSNFHSLLLCFIVYLGITADKNVNPSSNCHNPKFIKGSWPANLTENHHHHVSWNSNSSQRQTFQRWERIYSKMLLSYLSLKLLFSLPFPGCLKVRKRALI